MWLWLALLSAFLLGFYDICKKKALAKNGPIEVLFAATAISTLLLAPCLFVYGGPVGHHLMLAAKAVLVSASWISGMYALKLLPITTVSPLKATRPFFVVLLSLLIFGEKLNALQYAGVALALASIALMSFSGKRDSAGAGDPDQRRERRAGYIAISVSIAAGVASALYDKHIMVSMKPLFVQSWTNLYITVVVGLYLLIVRALARRSSSGVSAFRWDWILLLTAVLITGADMAYFFALGSEGALLSVISIVRRCAVLVTFVFGALIFKEKNLRGKSFALLVLLAGMVCLMLAN
ncbi:MAG: DMT family transporter [Bacteroidales bacterium]|nr:DMT family transporter [Bacteroidales bacterium]